VFDLDQNCIQLTHFILVKSHDINEPYDTCFAKLLTIEKCKAIMLAVVQFIFPDMVAVSTILHRSGQVQ